MAAEPITFFGLALVFAALGLVLGLAVGYAVGFVKGRETERQRRTEKEETT